MPKEIGTEVLNLKRVRSIQSFSLDVGTPAGDVLNVTPVIERRDAGTNALVEVLPGKLGRFSEGEVRGAIAAVPELAAIGYDNLRAGLSKLMHALLDTR